MAIVFAEEENPHFLTENTIAIVRHMADMIIDNPILNFPFLEPSRHFRFSEDGITNEIIEGRRISSYFVPIPKSKKSGRNQLSLTTEWTEDRIEENKLVNDIRVRVKSWRERDYEGATTVTKQLLRYWSDPDRDRKLFFCQREALETVIYLTEIAEKSGDAWMLDKVREGNEECNPGLYRLALKMATGTGKTVVMAMLIAWQSLNKIRSPQNALFSDTFLLVAPGITIRDRLRVLLPNDPENYYRARDIVTSEQLEEMKQATIMITNFHAFTLRERGNGSALTKKLLSKNGESPFKEKPEEMVRRVCRGIRGKKNIVVINDEAHHCYRKKPDGEQEKLTGEERQEAKEREKAAQVWLSGLEAIQRKIGIRSLFDLSATPFFLQGSGWKEGTLFPWVVSDFSLIDAIEAGLVKVPRVPVSDNQMSKEMPTFRNLWPSIRADLPRKGRRTEDEKSKGGDPKIPKDLQVALHTLYENYEKRHQLWEERGKGTPPVFIVVCNNTNVSKLVCDYISGYEKTIKNGETVCVEGALPLFSNIREARWLQRPNTILIDSQELDSGEALSKEFKQAAAVEIEEFKREYKLRFPERDIEDLTDEDLLREVMNTVGKEGKLGERIKCVVSVSMLTEGWDANTVTHILGVRAFGTQLLCEQVVGRALRRMSYATNENGLCTPEYAEVFGVPFSFIPCAGSTADAPPGPVPTRVRALPDRFQLELTFPRVMGYRFEMAAEHLRAEFNDDSKIVLSTEDVPTKVHLSPIVGESIIATLDDLKKERMQSVAFFIAKLVMQHKFQDDEGSPNVWLFPDILRITKEWLASCVYCKDDTFPQMFLLHELAETAAEHIYKSIIRADAGVNILKPILRPYDTVGSTKYVDFDTIKPTYATSVDKCHVSHVAADTQSWEQKMAQSLEEMDEVIAYVKNDRLGFVIPYLNAGVEREYFPDFLVKIKTPDGEEVHVIVEVTGEKRKDKMEKVQTARELWVPAINNHGGFGRWMFVEIQDPYDCKNLLRAHFSSLPILTPA